MSAASTAFSTNVDFCRRTEELLIPLKMGLLRNTATLFSRGVHRKRIFERAFEQTFPAKCNFLGAKLFRNFVLRYFSINLFFITLALSKSSIELGVRQVCSQFNAIYWCVVKTPYLPHSTVIIVHSLAVRGLKSLENFLSDSPRPLTA